MHAIARYSGQATGNLRCRLAGDFDASQLVAFALRLYPASGAVQVKVQRRTSTLALHYLIYLRT